MENKNKTPLYCYITAVLFLISVCVVGVKTAFGNLGAIKEAVKTKDAEVFVSDMENIYKGKLFMFDKFINLWSIEQKIAGTKLYDDAQYGYIIQDDTGKLHFPVSHKDITNCLNQTVLFDLKLKEHNIPFVYVQAPDKMLKGYTIYPEGAYNFSNEDADDFLEGLEKQNVNTLDLRELIIKENLNRDSLFYKTDHHWTTKTAFWAYGEVVEYLDSEFKLYIDPDYFYRDINNYNITEYEKCFLGSLGRRVGEFAAGLDDYSFIYPKFETDYTVYNGAVSLTEPKSEGDFIKALTAEHILLDNDVTANKHAAYFEWDYGNLIIKNNNVNNGIKLLLIKDSFSLPLAAFLSTSVSELHMVDLRDSNGLVPAEYAVQNDFDAVIILYNTEIFDDPMFNLN